MAAAGDTGAVLTGLEDDDYSDLFASPRGVERLL
jgi:hypothetical protein